VLADLWSPAEVSRDVTAPPEAVFAVLSDPRTYPDWLVGAQRIRAVDPTFPAPGAEFDHSVGPTEGATVDDSSEVIDADPPHHLALEVRVGILAGVVELDVLPSGAGSTIRFRERPIGPAAVLTPLVRPLLRRRNATSLEQLAEQLAAGAAGRP
jgi:uncharacterized protein YndB with AHSA1/START domain